MSWCILNSREVILKNVGETNTVNVDEAIEPNKYKRSTSRKIENEWEQKMMHRQVVRDKDVVDWYRS